MKIRVKVEVRMDHPNPGEASPAWADRVTELDVQLDDGRQGAGVQPTVASITAVGKLVTDALKAVPR